MELAVVMTTLPKGKGAALAKSLVGKGLVACAQVLPIKSFYVWEGSLVEDEEELLMLKLPTEKEASLREELEKVHPYEVPEILSFKASANLPYYEWASKGEGF